MDEFHKVYAPDIGMDEIHIVYQPRIKVEPKP
jgi:hypothetical protein